MLYCQELLSKAVKIAITFQFLCLNSTYCLAQTEKEIPQEPSDIQRESQLFDLGTTFAFTKMSYSQDSNLRVTHNTNNHAQFP